jgi:hypothetical protein
MFSKPNQAQLQRQTEVCRDDLVKTPHSSLDQARPSLKYRCSDPLKLRQMLARLSVDLRAIDMLFIKLIREATYHVFNDLTRDLEMEQQPIRALLISKRLTFCLSRRRQRHSAAG